MAPRLFGILCPNSNRSLGGRPGDSLAVTKGNMNLFSSRPGSAVHDLVLALLDFFYGEQGVDLKLRGTRTDQLSTYLVNLDCAILVRTL